jgi:hypothetical protein
VRLRLDPESAADSDVVNDQDPGAGRLVARRTRILVRAAAAPVVAPSAGPTAVVIKPEPEADLESITPSASRSGLWPTVGISVLVLMCVLLALLVLRQLPARAPKRADWVDAHVRARAVIDVAGAQTTSPSGTIPSLSIRISSHIDPGRHTLQETSR